MKPHEEHAEKVLSTFSVLDLVEQSDERLAYIGEKSGSDPRIRILSRGRSANFIEWWKVSSGGNRYEVRRFANFYFCSCPGFFYGKAACKHIAAVAALHTHDDTREQNDRSEHTTAGRRAA